MGMSEKACENKLRRALMREGFLLKKARGSLSIDNLGGYQIVNGLNNTIEAGERFDLSLVDVATWLEG